MKEITSQDSLFIYGSLCAFFGVGGMVAIALAPWWWFPVIATMGVILMLIVVISDAIGGRTG